MSKTFKSLPTTKNPSNTDLGQPVINLAHVQIILVVQGGKVHLTQHLRVCMHYCVRDRMSTRVPSHTGLGQLVISMMADPTMMAVELVN